jgi:hypothetical protein
LVARVERERKEEGRRTRGEVMTAAESGRRKEIVERSEKKAREKGLAFSYFTNSPSTTRLCLGRPQNKLIVMSYSL